MNDYGNNRSGKNQGSSRVKSSKETPSESGQLSAALDLLRDILKNGTAGTGKSRFRYALREPAAAGSETLPKPSASLFLGSLSGRNTPRQQEFPARNFPLATSRPF
jgi:hypothetical protein